MIQKALQKWVEVPVYETVGGAQSGGAQPGGIQSGGTSYRGGQSEEKNMPALLLLKNLLYAAETITRDKPAVVVLDTKGFYPGELEKFRSCCAQLFAEAMPFKILAIGNSEHKDSSILRDVVSDWCMDTPIDPVLIVSKVKMLLAANGKIGINDSRQSETDVLLDNLIGFLHIK
ncbi:MAG: hypothetical protein HQK96_05235 [Nitrospirae bacterium]|nr:hypothetical protein [Nitrospirota bacterium]